MLSRRILILACGMLAGCGTAPSAVHTPATPAATPAATADPMVQTAPALEPETMSEKVVRSDDEWKSLLSPEQYHVLRQKGTERPFVNKYDEHFEPGTYSCAACGQVLFASKAKFNSGCGWPAFYAAEAGDRVKLTADVSHGMVRTEVTCSKCDSHLGHIFDDAPQTPTGQRYCINSVSLKFTPGAAEKTSEEESKE